MPLAKPRVSECSLRSSARRNEADAPTSRYSTPQLNPACSSRASDLITGVAAVNDAGGLPKGRRRRRLLLFRADLRDSRQGPCQPSFPWISPRGALTERTGHAHADEHCEARAFRIRATLVPRIAGLFPHLARTPREDDGSTRLTREENDENRHDAREHHLRS